MRRHFSTLFTSLMLIGLLGGCVVRSHSTGRSRAAIKSRDCPPAHHWENGACVHNGKAKGHHKR